MASWTSARIAYEKDSSSSLCQCIEHGMGWDGMGGDTMSTKNSRSRWHFKRLEDVDFRLSEMVWSGSSSGSGERWSLALPLLQPAPFKLHG